MSVSKRPCITCPAASYRQKKQAVIYLGFIPAGQQAASIYFAIAAQAIIIVSESNETEKKHPEREANKHLLCQPQQFLTK